MNKEKYEAVKRFTAQRGVGNNEGTSWSVRCVQRGQLADIDNTKVKYYKEQGALIEEYIKISGGSIFIDTFRGILTDNENDNNEYLVGKVIDMGGTSSWSSDFEIALDFSKWNYTHEGRESIVFMARKQSMVADISNVSEYKEEREFLVSKDVRYIVTYVKYEEREYCGRKYGYKIIEVEEV